jgi:hypothetical protein
MLGLRRRRRTTGNRRVWFILGRCGFHQQLRDARPSARTGLALPSVAGFSFDFNVMTSSAGSESVVPVSLTETGYAIPETRVTYRESGTYTYAKTDAA